LGTYFFKNYEIFFLVALKLLLVPPGDFASLGAGSGSFTFLTLIFEMHNHSKTNKNSISTLLNETGNIQLYRVSEETRKKGLLNFIIIII
jgi:hypothetical protein